MDIQNSSSPQMEVLAITPKMATEYLRCNTENRSVRPEVVDAYARDMADGEWLMTGEAIKFGLDGRLLDGQHRLFAVVKSGATVEFLVITGLDPKTQRRVDLGVPRTFVDDLRMEGLPYYVVMGSVARRIHAYNRGVWHTGRGYKPTKAELEAILRDNFDSLVAAASNTEPNWRRVDIPRSVQAFVYWLLHEINPERATKFMYQLTTGADLWEGHPIMTVRDRLAKEKREKVSNRSTRAIWLVAMAWNAWMRGENMSRYVLKAELTKDTWPGLVAMVEPGTPTLLQR